MSHAALEVLTDTSLRVTLLAAIVASIVIALRVRSNSALHAAWTAVLFAMLLMPGLRLWVPAIVIPAPVPFHGAAVVPDVPAVARTVSIPADAEQTARIAPERAGPALMTDIRATVPRRNDRSWPFIVFIAYGAVTLILTVRLGVGWCTAARIVRRSDRIALRHERGDGARGAAATRVCESTLVVTPVTIGAFTPTILLPANWRAWPEDQLRGVLAHELAHVARRDTLVALFAHVNRCVFWFHPLAWWLERQLAITAEHACDDAGVRAVGDARRYAHVLVDIAAAAGKSGGRLVSQAIGIDSGLLARRIDRLLHGHAVSELSVAHKVIIAASCASAILVVAACRPSGSMVDQKQHADPRGRVTSLIQHYPDTEVAVRQVDRPQAEKVLLRMKAQDPTGPWSSRLGRFYAASIAGRWVRISERGPSEEITDVEPNGPFARAARRTLAESTDDVLLKAAAEFLLRSPRRRSSSNLDEFDRLAMSCLEKAVKLNPESVEARADLVALMARARRHETSVLRKTPPVSQYEVVSSMPESERFDRLPDLALNAFRSARGASRWDDPNLNDYVRLALERSRKFALDLLALAPKFRNHPNYGTAVYKANMTLGSLALRDGNTRSAVEYLRQAAAVPPTEELTYGRGIASWKLIDDLVRAGERETVAEFLGHMARINIVERTRLLDAADTARRGQTPVITDRFLQ